MVKSGLKLLGFEALGLGFGGEGLENNRDYRVSETRISRVLGSKQR